MAINPGKIDVVIKQGQIWAETFRYGPKVGPRYPLSGGWTGRGAVGTFDGAVPITVAVTPESVSGEGGQIVVSVDTTEITPGSYSLDIWLKPPLSNPYVWLTGSFTVESCQVGPPV